MLKKTGLLAVLALAGLSAVAACDDNPLAENRDVVDRLATNPSFANVQVGGSTFVSANALNQHGEPTGDAVTGTACDGKITVAIDTTRSDFELPERFIVRGVTAGESCVNVSSGGKSATVTINVVQ
jgi:hypothetical protein